MAILDEELQLSRAQLALDAMAIGRALFDRDAEEARFRTHLVLDHAELHGYPDVCRAADIVASLLRGSQTTVVPGIGRALLSLSCAIDAV